MVENIMFARLRATLFMLFCVMFFFLSTPGVTLAQDALPPDVLVKAVTDEVLAAIRNDPDIARGDKKKAIALIEQKMLPYIAFERMTRLAMGLNWRKATVAQRAVLVEEFQKLLLHVYAGTLVSYRSARIEQKALQIPPGATEVNVRLEVIQSGVAPIQIVLAMEDTPTGWKAYDITFDGVSLVLTYRDGFAREVSQIGIDGLIQKLRDKNRANGN